MKVPPAGSPLVPPPTVPGAKAGPPAAPPVDSFAAGPGAPETIDLGAAARALDQLKGANDETVSLWRLDAGHYSPTAYVGPDGTVYEAGEIDPEIRALGPDGRVRWTAAAGSNDLGALLAPGPGGRVYVSRVVGVEAFGPDGSRLWELPLSDSLSLHGAAGPEGNYYIHDRNRLYAVSPDGKKLWERDLERAWDDDPPVVGPDGTVYALERTNVVHAFTPDGKEKWAFRGLEEKDPFLPDVTTALAAGPDGSVYFGDRWGVLHAVGPDGQEKWSAPLGKEYSHYESPSVDGQGRVYVGDTRDGDTVVAFDPSGKELWRREVGSLLHVTGAPDGGVLVGVKGGHLHRLGPDGQRQWKFKEATVFTRPAFGPAGEVYTGAGKTLYAVMSHDEHLRRQRETVLEEARKGGGEPAPEVVEGDGWILVGDVRLPRRGSEPV